jgi:hypothetical protein
MIPITGLNRFFMQDIIDGANVKMDKAGGYREALRTILKAQELNKKVSLVYFYSRSDASINPTIQR